MKPEKEGNETASATPRNLLDRCLVDGDSAANSRRRGKTFGISLVLETAAVALLVVAPLLSRIAQPNLTKPTLGTFFFGAAHTRDVVRPHTAHWYPPANHNEDILRFEVGHVAPRPAPVTQDSVDSSSPPSGFVGDPLGAGILNIGGVLPSNLAPKPPGELKKPEEKHSMRVSGTVEQALLISRIEPRYPPLAVQTKMQGTVILHAIIDRDGNISSLNVLSGHPLFVKAALDAVRQWRYRPTLLNGEPVEVETTITVNFRLQQ